MPAVPAVPDPVRGGPKTAGYPCKGPSGRHPHARPARVHPREGTPRMTDHLTDYAQSTVTTPQGQPIPGRTDMVQNRAGGWTFRVEDWGRLRRFLILGSAATYYAGAREMT